MNRRNTRIMFYSLPIAQVVTPKTLNTEKNQLVSIMASYIAKQTDREKTLIELTALEKTLKPS
jgi:hypothetical protein